MINNPKIYKTKHWTEFKVGDIVSRLGTDEQIIREINPNGDLIKLECIKSSTDNLKIFKVGDIEYNIPWRYEFVRTTIKEK